MSTVLHVAVGTEGVLGVTRCCSSKYGWGGAAPSTVLRHEGQALWQDTLEGAAVNGGRIH